MDYEYYDHLLRTEVLIGTTTLTAIGRAEQKIDKISSDIVIIMILLAVSVSASIVSLLKSDGREGR